MQVPVFVPIVEGHGEVQAVPILLRRIAGEAGDPFVAIGVNPPIRVKAGSFINDQEYFGRYVSLAAEKARQAAGIVVILLDCEDDCAAELGPRLAAQARAVRADVTTLVCLAVREYETWFLAAALSLRGQGGLPVNLEPPPDAERIRNAKGWLSQRMPGKYDPIVHQSSFTSVFDLDAAKHGSRSFVRLFDRLSSTFVS
jgi:hypothetical protein